MFTSSHLQDCTYLLLIGFRSTSNLPNSPSLLEENNDKDDHSLNDVNFQVQSEAVPQAYTPPAHIRKKRVTKTPFETAVLKHLTEMRPVDEEVEGDKNFLLSFLPVMKTLPLDKKMMVRMAITQIMHQAVSNNPIQTPYFPPTTPYQLTNYNFQQPHLSSNEAQHVYNNSNKISVNQNTPSSSYHPQTASSYNRPTTNNTVISLPLQNSQSHNVVSPLSESDYSDIYSVCNDDLTEL